MHAAALRGTPAVPPSPDCRTQPHAGLGVAGPSLPPPPHCPLPCSWFHHTLVDADLAINSMMWQNAGKVRGGGQHTINCQVKKVLPEEYQITRIRKRRGGGRSLHAPSPPACSLNAVHGPVHAARSQDTSRWSFGGMRLPVVPRGCKSSLVGKGGVQWAGLNEPCWEVRGPHPALNHPK